MPILEVIQNKILDDASIDHRVGMWRFLGKKIVFTNGCFDLLHLGHIDYLSKASDEGDLLVVGLNSDESTSRLKGPNRPINKIEQRSMVIASLRFVDAVIVFDEETPFNLIKRIQPDVLIKGGDYKEADIVGADIVKNKDGIVKTIEFLPGYSTTLIEAKIRMLK